MPDSLTAPDPLRPGDSVHIVAPSGPLDREAFEHGVTCLHDHGLRARYDDAIFSRNAYLAGSDQRRCSELRAALNDRDCRAIWFARGGYGATRLLPMLDREIIARTKPWLVGFSDATALHALWQTTGLQSLHGANISGINRWSKHAREGLFGWLFDGTLAPLQGTVYKSGPAVSGRIAGGNLAVLASLAGTGYLPSFTGAIVFIEDIAERPYRLDRYITQLAQANAFIGVVGFAIGQLTHCVDPPSQDHGRSALDVVCQLLEPFDVPILGALAIGHEHKSQALPMGAWATLDSERQELQIAPLTVA